MCPSQVDANPYTHLWNAWKCPFLEAGLTNLFWHNIPCVTADKGKRLVSCLSVLQKLRGSKQETDWLHWEMCLWSAKRANYRQITKPTRHSRKIAEQVAKENPIRPLRTYSSSSSEKPPTNSTDLIQSTDRKLTASRLRELVWEPKSKQGRLLVSF